jgi:integrase
MGVKVWKGAWWLFIDHKGRRKSRRVGTGNPGKKAANLAAVQIQAKLASGDASVFEETRAKALTLQECAEGWLKNYVGVQRKPGTAEKYDMILRKHWFPPLGRLPLTGLTRERIKGCSLTSWAES